MNGYILPIAQLAPNFLMLREPTDHQPASAEIMVSIDGRERRWNVYLPDGISPTEPRTRIVAAK